MTFENLLIIIGSVVGFTAFMIWKDQVWAWLVARRRPRSVNNFEQHGRAVMSYAGGSGGSEVVRNQYDNAANHLDIPDTHQPEPAEPARKDEAPAFAVSHNMDDQTLIILLAAQKDKDGKPRWSANKIVEMIGGTRQEVLDTIAIVRPRDPSPPSQPPKPHYPTPLTPEQGAEWEARRAELELDH